MNVQYLAEGISLKLQLREVETQVWNGIKDLLHTDDTPDNYLKALCILLLSVWLVVQCLCIFLGLAPKAYFQTEIIHNSSWVCFFFFRFIFG